MNAPGLAVLLVEDNPVDAMLQARRLTKYVGAATRVVHAETVASAKNLLLSDTFDVVLLDLNLADSQGPDTVRVMRKVNEHVPIVALTGLEDEASAMTALQCGAQDYLVKTAFDSELLGRTIRYAIERARAGRDRVAVEGKLQQALKLEALGQLAAGIAHEINTPIQFIGDNCRFVESSLAELAPWFAAVEALVDGVRAAPQFAGAVAVVDAARASSDVGYLVAEMPKSMQQAQEGVVRVATIVRAMKQFCHPGDAVRAQAHLNDALESTITISRNEWKYCAKVECSFDPALPPVECHLGEINQVFLNLIVNAAHAIASRQKLDPAHVGVIHITTRTEPDHVVVEIADNGCGIPAAIQHKMFTPFFTTKEPGKGTGQGLAIAHTVMQSHGGTVWFESVADVGTTFFVRLPIGSNAVLPVTGIASPPEFVIA